MAGDALRDYLHDQIDGLPSDVLAEVVDFTAFVLARRGNGDQYSDWTDQDWQAFALEQLQRNSGDEEVEYSLDDAREVFRR
jgi:hypothetical protein